MQKTKKAQMSHIEFLKLSRWLETHRELVENKFLTDIATVIRTHSDPPAFPLSQLSSNALRDAMDACGISRNRKPMPKAPGSKPGLASRVDDIEGRLRFIEEQLGINKNGGAR